MQVISFFFFFWLQWAAWGILVPHSGIEPWPSAVKFWSLNHWTTRELPCLQVIFIEFFLFYIREGSRALAHCLTPKTPSSIISNTHLWPSFFKILFYSITSHSLQFSAFNQPFPLLQENDLTYAPPKSHIAWMFPLLIYLLFEYGILFTIPSLKLLHPLFYIPFSSCLASFPHFYSYKIFHSSFFLHLKY